MEKFGKLMEIIDTTVNPDHISTLKKHLDKAEIKNVCHDIVEQCLITLLGYQNIRRDTNKRHKSNYMGFEAIFQSHKDKLNERNQQ